MSRRPQRRRPLARRCRFCNPHNPRGLHCLRCGEHVYLALGHVVTDQVRVEQHAGREDPEENTSNLVTPSHPTTPSPFPAGFELFLIDHHGHRWCRG